jgi:hypothetical protein
VSALKKPSASVMAAGIVSIVGSVLVLLGAAMGLMGVLMAPMTRANPELPHFALVIAGGTVAFIMALGIFGVFSGVGLLRLKNWARVSTLVWAGITVVFAALVLVVFAFAPFPTSSNTSANLSGFVRATVLIFYGMPLAIGIWWLILFNQQVIANQFLQGAGGPLDASGFPEPTSASKPSLPLPIAVLGVFLLISSLSVIMPLFLPVPVILFGHAIRGVAGIATWFAVCFLYGAAGIGLLRLKPWSYVLTLGLQLFWFLSGIVTLASGNYPALIHEAMSSMQAKLGGEYPEYPAKQMLTFSYIGLAVPVLILTLLVSYRSRFLEASASKTGSA